MRESRKLQLIILMVLVCLVGTMSIAYAILSTTLNINGQAEISSASWDIYLDNPQVVGGSVTVGIPTITDKTTATFSTTLSKPGDYYMFTVDVVNNGTIDAMIDGIIKSPTLTEAQAKNFNYAVEYQNGESITTKQLVAKNSFVRLKVKVEFRKDITASDLPTQSETLSLSFKVNYVQSDENSENITIDNNGKLVKVVSGDYDTIGSEICIGNECFYVISSDEDSVTMLAKYNLYVGNECSTAESSSCIPYGKEATGLQDSTMIGYGTDPRNGVIEFSSSAYWGDVISGMYVYNSNSILYDFIENYKTYLENQGFVIKEARLIKLEELEVLGCSMSNLTCIEAPEWVYTTSYWSGSVDTGASIWRVFSDDYFGSRLYSYDVASGVRPVITIDLDFVI